MLIYNPNEIGVLSTILSIVSVSSVFFSLSYNKSILISSESDYHVITKISILLSLILFLIYSILIYIFKLSILSFLNLKIPPSWLLIVPVLSFTMSLNNIFQSYFSKKNQFGLVSKFMVTENIIYNGFAIIFGKLLYGLKGLFVSKILSHLINSFLYVLNYLRFNSNIKTNKKKVLSILNKYKNYPTIVLPHSLFTSLTKNIPILLTTTYFSPELTGIYFIGLKFSSGPISLLTSSLMKVYQKEFSETKFKIKYFNKRFKLVLFIQLFILSGMFLFLLLINIFQLNIIPNDYKDLIIYLKYLIPLNLVKMGSIFTVTGFLYYNKQKLNFTLEILLSVLSTISLLYSIYIQDFLVYLRLNLFSTIIIVLIRFYFLKKSLKHSI